MISNKEALATLIKSLEGTMTAAGMALTSKANPEELDPITYSGEYGEVELSFEENVLNIKCKAEGQDWKTVAATLFDLSDEEWSDKLTKSAANVACEGIAKYYGTELVYPGKTAKGKSSSAMTPEIEEFLEKGKKKKKARESGPSYDAVSLGYKMENIFPEIKGYVDENIAKYEMFLPEEFFEQYATPRIVESIKTSNRQNLKKIFNTFNTFYEEGDNDIQSLIAVSVLGVSMAKDDGLLQNCESFMEDDLHDAVLPVIKYLKGSGKKQLDVFANPQPYVPKKFGKSK